MTLLEKLIDEQRKRGLSDRAFARELRVSQALWSKTKRGRTPIGHKLMSAVVREYPLLANDIVKYLAGTDSGNSGAANHNRMDKGA